MAPSTSTAILSLLSAASFVAAEGLTWAPTPLIDLHFPTPSDAPYKVWPDEPAYERGPQSGYNKCNSTTEDQDSLCQTAYVNGLDDFCLWAPTTPNSVIGDVEGDVVAWCTKKGYGTRTMIEGTITGAQLLKSNDYWMITGSIDQTKLNIQQTDTGGELDSGSQDGRGNPIGGLVYSSAFHGSVYQVNWWTEFIGSNSFCIKICNPDGQKQSGYCQHTLDRIGLSYNCPSKYNIGEAPAPGDFEVCDTENMVVPGIYTDAAGQTQSYAQPSGDIGDLPYQPTLVASSNCQKTASASLFTELLQASTTPAPSASGSAPSGSNTASGSKTTAPASGSQSGSSANPSQTGSGNGAARLAVGSAMSALVAGFVFVAFI